MLYQLQQLTLSKRFPFANKCRHVPVCYFQHLSSVLRFGVCCLFLISATGTTINQNCTYLRNPGFPSAYSGTGSLSYTISKCSSGNLVICLVKSIYLTCCVRSFQPRYNRLRKRRTFTRVHVYATYFGAS